MPTGRLRRIPRKKGLKSKVNKLASSVRMLKSAQDVNRVDTLIGMLLDNNDNDTGLVFNASPVPATARDGDKIKPLFCKFRYIVKNNTLTPNGSYRVVVVQDKNVNDPVDSTLVYRDIFKQGLGLTSSVIFNNRKRWKILYDKAFNMSDSGSSSQLHRLHEFKYKFPKSATIRYGSDQELSGHLGNIYVLALAKDPSNTINVNTWNLNGLFELTYTE
jgi:hypothetical protein